MKQETFVPNQLIVDAYDLLIDRAKKNNLLRAVKDIETRKETYIQTGIAL